MPNRELPARPSLDHLKNEAKALQHAFDRGEAEALERVTAVLGAKTALKLTDAQRALAREYGFASWAKLRSHVQAARGLDEALDEFLAALDAEDAERALAVFRAQPEIASTSPHAAAALGRPADLRSIIARDASAVRMRAGKVSAEPLLVLCFSPFQGEGPERDDAFTECVRILLDAGADPNAREARYGVTALYAVTGHRNVPRIARMLLEAGANPTDGESVFHAAEHYHIEALELLREFGVDLNYRGDWGNTAIYFLLRYWSVEEMPQVKRGMMWLLDHGADPNVFCAAEQESALHVAVRRRQHPAIIRILLDRGANVNLQRGDGRTAWVLARRAGVDEVVEMLERAGATPQPVSAEDALLAACGRGDEDAARTLARGDLLDAVSAELRQLLHDAARRGELSIVRACLATGFPASAADDASTTALHHACIEGQSAIVDALLRHDADFRIRDEEHHATPLGWALFGADFNSRPDADFEGCVRALLGAGDRPDRGGFLPKHAGVSRVLKELRDA